jgi:hypothetical protein
VDEDRRRVFRYRSTESPDNACRAFVTSAGVALPREMLTRESCPMRSKGGHAASSPNSDVVHQHRGRLQIPVGVCNICASLCESTCLWNSVVCVVDAAGKIVKEGRHRRRRSRNSRTASWPPWRSLTGTPWFENWAGTDLSARSRPCRRRGSGGGGLICVSIATWQQSQAVWAKGVSLASKPRFAS